MNANPAEVADGKVERASLGCFRNGLALTLLIALAGATACDGPNEKAGREQDRALANAAGIEPPAEGPAEKIGEAQDRADVAAAKARDAAAEVLETQAEALRRNADVAADRLDERASAVRNGAQIAPMGKH